MSLSFEQPVSSIAANNNKNCLFIFFILIQVQNYEGIHFKRLSELTEYLPLLSFLPPKLIF